MDIIPTLPASTERSATILSSQPLQTDNKALGDKETAAWLNCIKRKSTKTAAEYRNYLARFERFLDGRPNISQSDVS